MLAIIDLIAVPDLADVDRVLQQCCQRPLAERDATDGLAIAIGPALGEHAPFVKLVDERSDRAKLDISCQSATGPTAAGSKLSSFARGWRTTNSGRLYNRWRICLLREGWQLMC